MVIRALALKKAGAPTERIGYCVFLQSGRTYRENRLLRILTKRAHLRSELVIAFSYKADAPTERICYCLITKRAHLPRESVIAYPYKAGAPPVQKPVHFKGNYFVDKVFKFGLAP